jgi:COP9 signalosome complex subunit 2
LNISPKEVEELLVGLILDAKVQGKIDQVNQVFELSSAKSSAFWKYKSIDRWATQLASLHTSVVSKLG